MKDLSIRLAHRRGSLAAMGEALGAAGVSVEGGGAWVVDGEGAAHFLVDDGDVVRARAALAEVGIELVAVRDVVAVRLRQEEPGQLGTLCRRMADAGVDIEVQYSDHDHRLILVVDKVDSARGVAEGWSGPGRPTSREDDIAALRARIAEWHRATRAGEVDTVLELMADDAEFHVAGKPTMRGRAAFAANLREVLRSHRVVSSGEVLAVDVEGDLATTVASLDVRIEPMAGGAPVRRSGEALSVWRRERDGAWRLVRDANLLA